MTAVVGPSLPGRLLRGRDGAGAGAGTGAGAEAGTAAASRPALGAMGALGIFGFFVALLMLAAFHSVIVDGQFDHDRLQDRLDRGRERSQVLREEVARLESPSRILEVAQGRLGMVSPPRRLYLRPVDPGDPLNPVPAPLGNPFAAGSP